MDKLDALKAVARNLRDLRLDTTPASSTGTSIDALRAIFPAADQMIGWYTYIYGGGIGTANAIGQDRVVTDFDPTNKRMIFSPAWDPVPSTNSNFIVTKRFEKSEYDNALERMIGVGRLKHLIDQVATLALVGSQYEYAVPSGLEYINTLRLVPSGSSEYDADDEVNRMYELDTRYWRVERNPLGTYIIAFDSRKISLDNFDNEWVRVMGQAKPVITATDNATIPNKLEEFIINGASMLLASQLMDEAQEWKIKFYMFRDTHRELIEDIFTPRRGKQVG